VTEDVRIIKKYQNRRLYDTCESRYIALSDVLNLIHKKEKFRVIDAKTKEDVTRSVLVQIILEKENGETPLFTTDMLENFIRHYDDKTRAVFSDFLDRNFQLFSEQQKMFQDQMGKYVGPGAMQTMTEMAQNNFDFWQKMQANFLKSTGFYAEKGQTNKK
jgi:polyhydroxyalkanoate synthesis repressor PhaR